MNAAADVSFDAAARQYVEELKRDIEQETLKRKALEAAAAWSDSFREDAIASLCQFELAVLEHQAAPLLLRTMIRSDIARALRSLKRAGQVMRRLNMPMQHLEAAFKFVRSAAKELPKK